MDVSFGNLFKETLAVIGLAYFESETASVSVFKIPNHEPNGVAERSIICYLIVGLNTS